MVGKPVLVGVSGQAVGLGVVLLAYCDYVLCDETSTFLTPYPKLGCLPEGAATLALPHVIGHRTVTLTKYIFDIFIEKISKTLDLSRNLSKNKWRYLQIFFFQSFLLFIFFCFKNFLFLLKICYSF